MKKKVEKQALSFEKEESLFEQAQRELKDDSNIVVKFTNKIISDGIEKVVINCDYNSEGFLSQYTSTGDWCSEANYTFKYTSFDKQGNWIERVIYSKETVRYMEQRIIEYF